jgi:hypothetical protein
VNVFLWPALGLLSKDDGSGGELPATVSTLLKLVLPASALNSLSRVRSKGVWVTERLRVPITYYRRCYGNVCVIRLGIDGIVHVLQVHFAEISGTFRIRDLRNHHEICRYTPDDIIDP